MSEMTYSKAMADSVKLEMDKNPDLTYIGEDPAGGAMLVFMDAMMAHPDRFAVSTITETANAGYGVGAAMCGLPTIVDMMYADLMPCAMDEIYNQAANQNYIYNGQNPTHCPVVFRAMSGIGTGEGLHHSHNLEAWFCHIPGLKVIEPAFPDDAKGLFTAAIRDGSPVICFTHRKLGTTKCEVPEGEYVVPLGKARIVREGKDVTLISWSYPVLICLQAAAELAEKGIEAEVLDLRTLVPLDREAVMDSVRKTGRAVIVSEEHKTGSFAGEISALLAEEVFGSLKAPVVRCTTLDTPVPFAALEDEYVITPEKIIQAVKKTLGD